MRILIAEDDAISRRVLRAMLEKWGYEVICVSDGQQAWQALQQEDCPRLVILDWMMPGMDGVEITEKFRQLDHSQYTYIILLTAKDRTEDIVVGMQGGADDYIVKPFDNGELQVRLNAARRLLDLQSKLLETQEALRRQATRDSLTDVLNRRALMDELVGEEDRASRSGSCLSAIMMDIDHFKSINDKYGHAAGDAVLCSVVKAVESVMRQYDSLGRYGGEEFVVIAPTCCLNDAANLAERIRSAVQSASIQWEGKEIPVTLSLGVAELKGKSGIEELLDSADQAMYTAKQGGRNQVQIEQSSIVSN